MLFKRAVAAFVVCCLAFILISCEVNTDNSTSDTDGKRIVAVTILPEKAFVKAVCGDKVNIITVVPPGASPETYELTPAQVTELNKADIYFKIGVPSENTKSFPQLNDSVVVNLADEVAKIYPDRLFDGIERDPHIWLSPKRAVVMVDAIARNMSEIDPDNKDYYTNNAKTYINELNKTDEYASSLFRDAKGNTTFLSFHPAYGYFADEYGLSMYSLEQEGREATPQDLIDMIKYAKEHNIKVMFAQAESASKQPASFATEVGGKVVLLNPLDEDYIKNIRFMAEQISEALKGE